VDDEKEVRLEMEDEEAYPDNTPQPTEESEDPEQGPPGEGGGYANTDDKE